MILIIGGAYQGKEEYALSRFEKEQIVPDFHREVRLWVEQGLDPVETLRGKMAEYADKVILCDDISGGIVPMDPVDRAWREAVGRCSAYLSRYADEVVRLFCGIPTRLK